MPSYIKVKIVLILLLAVVISICTYAFLKSKTDDITIVVANQDIGQRTWVEPEMLREISIRRSDKQILAPNAYTSKKQLENAVTMVEIPKGKVIDKNIDVIAGTMKYLQGLKVVSEDGRINDSYFLSDNRRIVTIRLDSQGSVNYTLKRGDRVDVILTGENGGESFSSTIMQHIEIFDIGTLEDSDKNNGQAYMNVSLAVSPQQAVDITLAKRTGKLDLVLNPLKGDNELIFPATMEKFIRTDSKGETGLNTYGEK